MRDRSSDLKVGVVGLGRMGTPYARRLAAAGFAVWVYNRTSERAQRLAREVEVHVAATPRELARSVEVVVTSLANGAALATVIDGEHGLAAGLRPGAVVIETSTVGPEQARAAAAQVARAGATLIDAPVSGSVAAATSGTLTILAGGAADDLERVRPVLEALGSRIHHVGPVGAGAAMKLVVNSVLFGLSEAVAEALVLAERADISRARTLEVLASSAVGAPLLSYRGAAYADPDSVAPTFLLRLAVKDMQLIRDYATSLGSPMPQAIRTLEILEAADQAGLGDADMAAVVTYLDSLAATQPQSNPQENR